MKMKFLRQQLEKSQLEVANDLEMPRTMYARYEANESNPKLEVLIKIADYFGVSLDYLCDRPFSNNIGYIPEDKKEVVKLILQLNQLNTIKLFGYVSGLIASQN